MEYFGKLLRKFRKNLDNNKITNNKINKQNVKTKIQPEKK
jgi:hypothetical protein